MLKLVFIIDFQENEVVFSEQSPLPSLFQDLINFVNKKVGFMTLKINERSEHDFNGIGFYAQKMSERHLYGCLLQDANPKRRLIYKLNESMFDLFNDKLQSNERNLNGNSELRKKIQLLIDDFNKGKGDITRKISGVQDKIQSEAIERMKKEESRLSALMEVKTDVEEAEKNAEENLGNAKIVKREAFILNAKMWLILYGSSAVLVCTIGYFVLHTLMII